MAPAGPAPRPGPQPRARRQQGRLRPRRPGVSGPGPAVTRRQGGLACRTGRRPWPPGSSPHLRRSPHPLATCPARRHASSPGTRSAHSVTLTASNPTSRAHNRRSGLRHANDRRSSQALQIIGARHQSTTGGRTLTVIGQRPRYRVTAAGVLVLRWSIGAEPSSWLCQPGPGAAFRHQRLFCSRRLRCMAPCGGWPGRGNQYRLPGDGRSGPGGRPGILTWWTD